VHVAPDTVSHPLQPENNALGLAVRVTTVSMLNASVQSVPQLIPPGLELTLPAIPVLLTVSTNRLSSNAAVTVFPPATITVHVAPETASHPVQPAKLELPAGVAVRVTLVLLEYDSWQSAPQLMPGGLEVTVPEPPPVFTTERVGSDVLCTVSVVLPLLPQASVAVIVVVPGAAPVATPAELMVATVVLLLVHVTPVPGIVTGVSEPVVVPLPN
jgi:hypothetical protein